MFSLGLVGFARSKKSLKFSSAPQLDGICLWAVDSKSVGWNVAHSLAKCLLAFIIFFYFIVSWECF